MSTVQPGSISHATHLDKDLLPAFINALCGDAEDAKAYWLEEFATGVLDCDDYAQLQSFISDFIFERLWNALGEIAPPGHYFGTHPGDGSDYGFWPILEEDEPEDDEEPTEPEEGDYELRERGDYTELWSMDSGKIIYDTEQGRPAIRAWLIADGHVPNCWIISDHGNALLVKDWS
jgi:hypothetical protein